MGGQSTGQPGGLAVISGAGAVDHARQLVKHGTWLVRVISDDPSRDMAEVEPYMPLITVRFSCAIIAIL